MKKYFEEQLKESIPIFAIQLPLLKGKSLYSDYKIGDKMVYFVLKEYGEIEPPYTEPSVTFSMKTVVERELDLMEDDYKYVGTKEFSSAIIPVFEKIKKDV